MGTQHLDVVTDGYPVKHLLRPENVAAYLWSIGLLSKEELAASDIRVEDLSSKNRNYVVTTYENSYFVKQQTSGESFTTLFPSREVEFYDVCRRIAPNLLRYLSTQVQFDKEARIVITEFLNARTLDYLLDNASDTNVHASLGRTVAEFQITFEGLLSNPEINALWSGESYPWILRIDELTPSVFATATQSKLRVLSLIQREPIVMETIRTMRASWQRDCIMHGDLKLDHVLWVSDQNQDKSRIVLTDWEKVEVGDSAWDIGWIFESYISHWLRRAATTGAMPNVTSLEATKRDIEVFWSTYVASKVAAPPINRVMQAMALRLLIRAPKFFGPLSSLPDAAKFMLDLALSILRDPLAIGSMLVGKGTNE